MRLAELAQVIGARLIGDGDVYVVRVAHVEVAGPDAVALVEHAHDRAAARLTAAAAVIVDEDFAADSAHELPCAVLAVPGVPRALRLAIAALHPRERPRPGIHAGAVVEDGATVAPSASIAAGAVVLAGAVIGGDSVVMAGAVVMGGVRIGAQVVIGPGAVIGGAPYSFDDDGATIDAAYGVVVGDGCVIGANACIDAGLVRDTTLGQRCHVDNLVQVGHDVVLGDGCALVAQTGLAGFGTFGSGVTFGGQAGTNPHVRVADRVRVGGRAGITNDVTDIGAAVSGMPAIPHLAWLKAMAKLKTLSELERRVRRLEHAPTPHRGEP